MPITQNAKKALRSSFKKRGFNLHRKKIMKEAIKGLDKILTDKKGQDPGALIAKAYQAIDKAVKRGVIKKNTAARKKSRLMARIKKSTTTA